MGKDQTPRQEALSFLADRLEEWRQEAGDPDGYGPEALSVEPRLVSRVVITIGGPAAWIEYDHRYGTAELYSTYSGEPVTVELTAEEAAEVESLFALEDRAAMACEGGQL
jgi:hypothetical protein